LANELELKAIVPDVEALRQALDSAGAVLRFHGMMRDRRLDREGLLSSRDQVFRVRLWSDEEGGQTLAEVAWKGPTSVDPDGYKLREELEFNVDDGETALQVLRSVGFSIVESIDRYVELFELEGTVARIEWFPRMDVLVEIEGSPEGIENLIAVTGLDRDSCLPDALVAFSQRYTERTGEAALLSEDQLDGAPPTWLGR
jgi:predicted adenylyl cyclase CyaB